MLTHEGPNSPKAKIKVIIADDHPLIITGITEILEKNKRFSVLETHKDGNSLMQSTVLPDVDVLLLDLNMPGKDGLQVLEAIKFMGLKLQVLVLTSYFSKELAAQCEMAGANGYILKSDNLDSLAAIILEVMDGKKVFPDFSKKTEEDLNEFTFLDQFLKKYNLTKREAEVIQMVCKGHNSKEIADLLFLSSFTVQTHRRNIFKKLNIEGNAISHYKFASEHGLL
ncbi:response regulator transcription factor [Aequorivita lipolytica]|uniref:Response regulator transcription factor n=1 Tax=Aequorivita lipolytica TaxID=153267 RepID=A0A5C6YND9_9FLAO|nr:response regulator transcription factor [Aequorivita lipolytica]TXD69122.1 response regulator transcription factor [Aequorivita lipolytica]SRX51301.1 Response regulator UvrY [Aequorivita lipolytica]